MLGPPMPSASLYGHDFQAALSLLHHLNAEEDLGNQRGFWPVDRLSICLMFFIKAVSFE